jgi:cell division septation protein DedD
MAQNDEGEFELVIGNRQLLLVFGVLLVLLGVLFTMGYLIGKNNPSKEAIAAANNRQVPILGGSGTGTPSSSPIIVDPGKQAEGTPSRSATELFERATSKEAPPKEVVKQDPLPEVPKVPKETEKKKEEPKKEAKKEPPAEPKVVAEKKPEAKPVASAPAGVVANPGAGTYVQVVAVDLEGANSWVGTLRGKSFSAMVAPGPNDKLYRVLIGPIKDKEALAQTKIDLEKLGVKGAFIKKY